MDQAVVLNHILRIHRSSSYLSQTESCKGLRLKSILLPSKLEVFTYLGFSLFLGEVKHNLHELPSLTKVTLHTMPDVSLSASHSYHWVHSILS